MFGDSTSSNTFYNIESWEMAWKPCREVETMQYLSNTSERHQIPFFGTIGNGVQSVGCALFLHFLHQSIFQLIDTLSNHNGHNTVHPLAGKIHDGVSISGPKSCCVARALGRVSTQKLIQFFTLPLRLRGPRHISTCSPISRPQLAYPRRPSVQDTRSEKDLS
jgi:hypothetical protein